MVWNRFGDFIDMNPARIRIQIRIYQILWILIRIDCMHHFIAYTYDLLCWIKGKYNSFPLHFQLDLILTQSEAPYLYKWIPVASSPRNFTALLKTTLLSMTTKIKKGRCLVYLTKTRGKIGHFCLEKKLPRGLVS